MEVFFQEPTKVHFIREIGRKINLAQTSTRNNIKELERKRLITRKKAEPFDGLVANRENEDFIEYKKIYNLYSLLDVKKKIIEEVHPKTIVLFGSYLRGEDIETSDIDLLIVSKVNKEIDFSKQEKLLERSIHLMFIKDASDLDKNLKKKIRNGFVLHGEL